MAKIKHKKEKFRNSNAAICILLTVIMLFMVSCGGNGAGIGTGADAPTDHLSLGERFLLELEYEQALFHFLALIEIEPMNPRGYTGAAQAHIGLGQHAEAIAILQLGLEVLPDNTSILDMLYDLRGEGLVINANASLWYSFTDEQRDMLTRLETAVEQFDAFTAHAIMSQSAFLELFEWLEPYDGQVRNQRFSIEGEFEGYLQFDIYGVYKSDENWKWELYSFSTVYIWSRTNPDKMRMTAWLYTGDYPGIHIWHIPLVDNISHGIAESIQHHFDRNDNFSGIIRYQFENGRIIDAFY